LTNLSKEGRLYDRLAKYYDQIYHWKDYEKEVRTLRGLIQKYKEASGKRLLDVACGTGKHIKYLRKEFNCTGVDSSAKMLAVARNNAAGVRFVRGNMVDFDLREQFDVVLCLFSSLGYLKTKSEIRKTYFNFSRHMKKGGVLIIEPWLRRSEWKDRTVSLRSYVNGPLIIARVSYARAEGEFSILDERYLVAQKNKGISYIKDRHRIRFFEVDSSLDGLREAGLNPEFTEESLMPGRGLLIATKPFM
jgi:ubiquinone/menaquinone biosynthesis C-methylase UbiE